MGCVGVPLYKIYPRKTEWKTVRPKESLEDAADKKITRNDSVDDMIAQVLKQRQAREARVKARVAAAEKEGDSSGRSTPEHLKNIAVQSDQEDNDNDDAPDKPQRKSRTFSETLKMLDDDILADLDVK